MLKEVVEIWTTYPEPLHKLADGGLVVGSGHLPELSLHGYTYTVASAPACWVLMPPKGGQRGVLLDAWREVEEIRGRLKAAEQETNHADD